MLTSRSFHLLLNSDDEGFWSAEWIDAAGIRLPNCPKFYSRYSLWVQAHALIWYANQLYKIKKTTTPLD